MAAVSNEASGFLQHSIPTYMNLTWNWQYRIVIPPKYGTFKFHISEELQYDTANSTQTELFKLKYSSKKNLVFEGYLSLKFGLRVSEQLPIR